MFVTPAKSGTERETTFGMPWRVHARLPGVTNSTTDIQPYMCHSLRLFRV
jgi:hypothetical protein